MRVIYHEQEPKSEKEERKNLKEMPPDEGLAFLCLGKTKSY
jgi:hypothetical protein